MTRCSALVLASLLFAACGGAPSHGASPVGAAGADGTGAVEGSIELALRRADGEFVDVGELRGQPVLLFVFATFDGVSQAVLRPLRALAERHPELRIVGIAAQPGARLLVEAYESALRPPFVVTYDPEETVSEGTSPLGAIEAVPTFIVLDRRGRAVARQVGFADEARLRELVSAAGLR